MHACAFVGENGLVVDGRTVSVCREKLIHGRRLCRKRQGENSFAWRLFHSCPLQLVIRKYLRYEYGLLLNESKVGPWSMGATSRLLEYFTFTRKLVLEYDFGKKIYEIITYKIPNNSKKRNFKSKKILSNSYLHR